MLFRNVGIRLPTHAASYPTRMESPFTPLRKPQNSRSLRDFIDCNPLQIHSLSYSTENNFIVQFT